MKRSHLAASFAALSILAAACGGGGGSSPVPSGAQSKGAGTLSVRITIPGNGSQARTAALRRALSAASSTSGIVFTVYAHGGSPSTPLAISGEDISINSSFCSPNGTGRSCIIPIASPAGVVDVLAQTYDQIIPVSGVVPAGAHLLAAGVAGANNVVAGQSLNLLLTANPVLATVSLTSTPALVHSLLPTSVNVSVNGFDAGGNLILAGNYVDQSGNPVTGGLTVTAPNNSASLTTTTFNGSGQTTQLTYNGAANVSGTLQVSSAAPFAGNLNITLLAPTIYTVADANLSGAGGGWQGATAFVATNNYIFYATPANSGVSFVTVGSNAGPGNNIPVTQTPNPISTAFPILGDVLYNTGNGSMFFGDAFSILSQQAFSGDPPSPVAPQVVATCTPVAPATCNPQGQISNDWNASGVMLWGDGTHITKWSSGGSATELGTWTVTADTPLWAGAAWDGTNTRLWLADSHPSTGTVYETNLVGASTTYFNAAPAQAGQPWGLSVDPVNNNAWAALTNKQIAKYTHTGTASPPSVTIAATTTGIPTYMASDTNAVWFSETNAGGGLTLGRIDLVTGVVAEYPVIASGSSTVAGPIVDMANPLPIGVSAGNVIGMVYFSGTASPGAFLLVVP